MDFEHDSLTLQLLGFVRTPNLFNSDSFLGYPVFETKEGNLSEEVHLDLELPDNLILGKRVEYLFAYYIHKFSSERILLQGKVISKDRITIGELDFILQNKNTSEISHVELVYKYYLYDPNFDEELDRWIGPNRKDSLVRKIKRLKLQQFPLLFREECREAIEPIVGPVENLQQKICFKANLFVPYEIMGQESLVNNLPNIKGYWIRQEDFNEEKYGDRLFYSPKKMNWPIDPKYCCNWYSFPEISEKLKVLLNQQRSPLLWMKMADGYIDQFFVVWW